VEGAEGGECARPRRHMSDSSTPTCLMIKQTGVLTDTSTAASFSLLQGAY
jgi:hypothetical protein